MSKNIEFVNHKHREKVNALNKNQYDGWCQSARKKLNGRD